MAATLIRPVHPSHWTWELGIYAPFPTLGDKELFFVFNPDKWVYEYLPGVTWEDYYVGKDDDDCQGESICVPNTDDDTPF